jgi:hypothetical protein
VSAVQRFHGGVKIGCRTDLRAGLGAEFEWVRRRRGGRVRAFAAL